MSANHSDSEAIAKLHDAGVSYRVIGKCLGRSEALMRHLEIAGLMYDKLKNMVRSGKASTREAVLYARKTGTLQRF